MRKKSIFLALIIFFFLATRLYKVADIPASVYWDEASIGYNAFSIAADLKDEWGEFLPLHFRAFGEFKLPVYIYSVVPFVKIFGLSAFSVRLPAVIYSLGVIFLTFLLIRKITKNESLGIIAAFALTLSPWFFIFSRTGYEAIAGLFFFLLGTYFLLSVERGGNFFFGVLAFILSFYSYNSFRIIIPIFLPILTLHTFSKKNLLIIGLSAFIFIISLIPVYRLYKFDFGGTRFNQVKVENTNEAVKNYIANFSPQFLFLKGDNNPRSQIPGHGQLYYLDIPFIVLGIIYIIGKKKFKYYLPLIILALAPIPAALTKESPHALRAILSVPSYAMLTSFGIYLLVERTKKHLKYVLAVILAAYLFFFGLYFADFIKSYNNETKDAWQYQYKKIFTSQRSGVVTSEYAQPYIFSLFYQKVPPSEFRNTVKYNPPDKWGFSLVSSFNGFEFR